MKAEEMFNSWFTMNLVDEIVPSLSRKVANENRPIRIEKEGKGKLSVEESALTVHTPMQSSGIYKQMNKVPISGKRSKDRDLSKFKVSQNYEQANYENDRIVRKIIRLVRDKNPAVISRLPPAWREKFISFGLDSKNHLYMDKWHMIPKDMRENVLCAIHFGHAG